MFFALFLINTWKGNGGFFVFNFFPSVSSYFLFMLIWIGEIERGEIVGFSLFFIFFRYESKGGKGRRGKGRVEGREL